MEIQNKILSIIKQNNYWTDLNLLISLYNDKLKFEVFMHIFIILIMIMKKKL